MLKSRRISVRLGSEQSERLARHCEATGATVTRVICEALDAFLASKGASEPSNVARKRLQPPEAIISLTAAYLAPQKDPRTELKSMFIGLLAASFALKRLYPRTAGIRELYEALVPLCPHFGVE